MWRSRVKSCDDVVIIRDVPIERGSARVISINRPDKRNAMNTEVIEHLVTGLVAADEDPDVAAIVLTGEGGSFSGGGDVGEFPVQSAPEMRLARGRLMADLFLLPRQLGTPVIAAAQGATVGGGAALALAADLVVAGRDLRLGFPELVRSITPATAMVGLAGQLGARLAFELLVTGRFLDAREALELRLVNRVVDVGEVQNEAIELAGTLSMIDSAAMQTTKRLLHQGLTMTDAEAVDAGMAVLWAEWSAEPH
jgi:enoyl-CoA hydratase